PPDARSLAPGADRVQHVFTLERARRGGDHVAERVVAASPRLVLDDAPAAIAQRAPDAGLHGELVVGGVDDAVGAHPRDVPDDAADAYRPRLEDAGLGAEDLEARPQRALQAPQQLAREHHRAHPL